MGSKTKVLWIGDAVATTGFARVNHSVIERLDKDFYDIHHLGVNYHGDPHEFDHSIYPAFTGGDVWGFGRLEQVVKGVNPDLIFILNDVWVIDKYLKMLKEMNVTTPVVTYFPVDAGGFNPGWFNNFDHVKRVVVYTEYGRAEVEDLDVIDSEIIEVIPHGSDPDRFYPFEDFYNADGELVKSGRDMARESIYPLQQKPDLRDSFIVLNANRNQPRKRIDITMDAFRVFSEGKDDVRLYLHMGNVDAGWDIQFIATKWGFDDKLILSTTKNQMPGIPDERLNAIYNATDIGINTSMGEGWGLVNWEHAAVGRPQIVPDHSALSELWNETGIMVPAPVKHVYTQTSTEGFVPDVNEVINALEWAYSDFKDGGEELAKLGEASREMTLRSEYSWDTISDKFDSIFREVLG